jgi:polar amino acid transport system permease protein
MTRAGTLAGLANRWGFHATLLALGALILANLDWTLVGSFEFAFIWEYRTALIKGFGITMLLTAEAGIVGILFGTLFAIGSQSPFAPLRWLVGAYVEVFRNTPLLVQLLWIHFALPLVTGISTTALVSGIIGIGLQAAAYYTEIMRAGIQAVPRGQIEAAHALGLPAWTRWSRVILPPAIRTVIPALLNQNISFFKATAIVGLGLLVGDFFTAALRVSNDTFHFLEPLTFAAAVYLVLGWLAGRWTLRLERRLSRGER